MVLSAIAAEEDMEMARNQAIFNATIYSGKIADRQAFIEFANKQQWLMKYANERMQLISNKVAYKSTEDRLVTDDQTLRLVNAFKYMKEHGILDQIKQRMDAKQEH